ncbi:hypothetical protein [Azospirillum aestuarii]|uniref:hypothetical protein n=1 Tax=Azospirillum aestuarii TaxID=2802052 RepID=UPI004054C945
MSFAELRSVSQKLTGNYRTSDDFDLILGPCAIESEDQLIACADTARRVGATYLRGGAIKLRTRYDAYSGPGTTGWEILGCIARLRGLKSVSEVTRWEDVEKAARHLDALQIGARCMWHFDLLKACAQTGRTIVLKRGLGATTLEWLAAAERLQTYGCDDIILCERGNRSADGASRNAIDISVFAFLADECPLRLWLDVSHSAGDPQVALGLLKRARSLDIAGVMAEIHPDPASAKCDSDQAISLSKIEAAFSSFTIG